MKLEIQFLLFYAEANLNSEVLVLTAVKSIKKQHLVEVRSMNNPPAIVKLALESIAFLLGEPSNDWRSIRGVVIKDNFISTIVNFVTEDIKYVLYRFISTIVNFVSEDSKYVFYRFTALLWVYTVPADS